MRRLNRIADKAVWVVVFVLLAGGGRVLGQAPPAPPAPAPAPATAPAAGTVDPKLKGLWENFLHYILILRPDAAESYGKAIIQAKPDPRQLYRLSVKEKKSDRTLAQGRRNKRLTKVIDEITAVIDRGALEVRRDPQEIRRWIQNLAGAGRAFLNAQDRLRKSGEYAVPQMMAALAAADTPDLLRERISVVLPRLGKDAVRPLNEALASKDPHVQEAAARALGKIGYPHACAHLQELARRKGVLKPIRDAALGALAACGGERVMKKSVAELFYLLAEKYYRRDESVNPDSRYDTANVWYWREGLGVTYKEAPRAIFNDIYAMVSARKALEHDESFYPAVVLWLAGNMRRDANWPYRVLLADAKADRRSKVKDLLVRRCASCGVFDVGTLDEGLEAARDGGGAELAVVPSDITAPDFKGAVARIRAEALTRGTPVLILAGAKDVTAAGELAKRDPRVVVLAEGELTASALAGAIQQAKEKAADRPGADFYAGASGPKYLQMVLARAMKDGDVPVAIRAIAALAGTSGAKSLVTAIDRRGGAQPLVEALTYPVRVVRYMAAETLARARPTRRFAGSDLVPTVLVEALRQTGTAAAVLADPDIGRRNKTKDLLRAIGYDVTDGEALGGPLAEARKAGGVDLFVLTSDIRSPAVAAALAGLRSEGIFSRTPAVVIATAGDVVAVRGQTRSDPAVEIVLDDPLDAAKLSAAVKAAKARSAGGAELSPDEAADWAIRAAGCLQLLAETRNPVYDLGEAVKSLIAALTDQRDPVRIASARALAKMRSADAQLALVVLGGHAAASKEVRLAAYAASAESVRLFGNELDEKQIDAVIAAVTAKGDLDLRNAAAQLLGALNLPSEKIKHLILTAP